jgi:recombinational DNA repair protein (RecF pathway)
MDSPHTRRCQKCGHKKSTVAYDRGARRDLCAHCWFSTYPEYEARMDPREQTRKEK